MKCDIPSISEPMRMMSTGACMQVYYRLQTMQTVLPAEGQLDGSYLTGWSSAGLQ